MPKIPRSSLLFHLSDTWLWEYLAATFSLTAMIAIVAVLAAFDEQDSTTWTFPLTINAVIATLNTISKSLSLFLLSAAIGQWKWIYAAQKPPRLRSLGYVDRLSRGPLGAAQVLWNSRL